MRFAVCPGRYIVSMSDAHELTDCVIINGDLAIQLSGSSKLHLIHFMSCLYYMCTHTALSNKHLTVLCAELLLQK